MEVRKGRAQTVLRRQRQWDTAETEGGMVSGLCASETNEAILYRPNMCEEMKCEANQLIGHFIITYLLFLISLQSFFTSLSFSLPHSLVRTHSHSLSLTFTDVHDYFGVGLLLSLGNTKGELSWQQIYF